MARFEGRRPLACAALVGLALLAIAGSARAEKPDPSRTAAQALAAHRAGDATALAALVASDVRVDPFLVVEALLLGEEAALGGDAPAAHRAEAAAAYAAVVARTRSSAGDVGGWLAKLRAQRDGAPGPDSPVARRRAYRAALGPPRDPAVVEGEEARWRGAAPDLSRDPILLLLATDVVARWHDRGDWARVASLAKAVELEARRIAWAALEAQALRWQAEALHFLRRDRESRDVAQRAADAWAAQGRINDQAYALQDVADASLDLGDVARMQRALEEAHALHVRAQDPVGVAGAVRRLAVAAHRQGRTADAITLFEQAIEQERRLALAPNLSAALRRRAEMWMELGRPERAIADDRESLALAETSGDAHAVAAASSALGTTLHRTGALAEARAALTRSVELFGAHGWRREAAEVTTHLARLMGALGEGEAALAALEKARADLEALGDRATLGVLRGVWADLLWGLGRKDAALAMMTAARADLEAAGLRHFVATAVGNIGLYLARMRRLPEARLAFQEAEALWIRLDMPEMVARNVERIAAIEVELGRPRQALRHVRRVLDMRFRLGTGLADDEALGGATTLHRVLGLGLRAASDALVTATTSTAAFLDEACWFGEAGSGLLLSRGLTERQELLAARVPPELMEANVRARERVRAALAGMDGNEQGAGEARAELDAAYLELEAVVARVQRDARRVAELVYPRPRVRADIAAALDEDEALVHFHLSESGVFAVVVRRGDATVFFLGPADLQEDVAELLRRIQTDAPEEGGASARLHARLLRPLEVALAGAKRLILCPDGPLHLLPFAALPSGPEGNGLRLGEQYEVSYAPSGTVLLALEEARASAAPARGVLALGDPVYPSEGGTGGEPVALRGPGRASTAHLARLPETAIEARVLAERFPSSDRVLLLRQDASRDRLLVALAGTTRRKAVHFACHALLDVARPRLCGVALSGGDLLTADDVDRLDVRADLVVLSACETGRGRIERGEGVAGLTRSFLLAGASRVLVSLWKVDDRATRLLMDAFYDGLFEGGLPAARALSQAQRAVRAYEVQAIDLEASRKAGRDVRVVQRPYEHPRHWAAWCLWGLQD